MAACVRAGCRGRALAPWWSLCLECTAPLLDPVTPTTAEAATYGVLWLEKSLIMALVVLLISVLVTSVSRNAEAGGRFLITALASSMAGASVVLSQPEKSTCRIFLPLCSTKRVRFMPQYRRFRGFRQWDFAPGRGLG